MRSRLAALCLVLLFFCELVLTAPSPLTVKGKAVGKNNIPLKKVAPKHSSNPKKKIPVKKASTTKPKPIKSKGTHGSSCPARKPIPKPKKIKREEDDFGLVRRATPEFLGFHGTTSVNAEKYIEAGRSKEPHLPTVTTYNGNDSELGIGFYVTDDFVTAQSFAITSSNRRPSEKTTAADPKVCMVEAISTTTWRTSIPKVWIPDLLIRKPTKEQNNLIECYAGYRPSETVKFSTLSRTSQTNQFSIPTTQFNKIFIRKCMKVSGSTTESQFFKFFRRKGLSDHYSSPQIRQQWAIKEIKMKTE